MSEEEINEDRGEQTETTAESYTQPDFETLGSVAAIGELMRRAGGGGVGPSNKI